MVAPTRTLAAMIGIALLAADGGCYRGHGRPVILQPRGHESFEGDRDGEPVGPDANGGYRPVQEYPVPAPAADSETGEPLPRLVPQRPSAGAPSASPSIENNGILSEPAATQRMLVPEALPKPKFWQRIGNGFVSAYNLTRGYRTVGTSALYEARAAGGQLAKKTAVAFKKPVAPTDDESRVSEASEERPIRFEANSVHQSARGDDDFETASSWYDHPARLSGPQVGSITPVPAAPQAESSNDTSRADFSTEAVHTADQGPRLLQ